MLFLCWFEFVPGRLGKSQKEGQEDQGEVKELGGTPLIRAFGVPCSSWPSFRLFPGLSWNSIKLA